MGGNQYEQYVIFNMENDHFAIQINEVYEIIRMQEVTTIPNSPEYLKGIINLRGRIIPVVNLRHRFGMFEAEPTKDTRIIVVNYDDETIGIIVDHVSQVNTFEAFEVENDQAHTFTTGIIHVDGKEIDILSVEKVLQQ